MDHLAWRTSSGNGNDCVEVAPATAGVLLRDTKDHGAGPVIAFSPAQWTTFLAEVASGAPGADGAATAAPSADGVTLHGPDGVRLRCTPSEWTACSTASSPHSSRPERRGHRGRRRRPLPDSLEQRRVPVRRGSTRSGKVSTTWRRTTECRTRSTSVPPRARCGTHRRRSWSSRLARRGVPRFPFPSV